MASAQRISRGFHRLAIFLAAIPLLAGGIVSLKVATEIADRQQARHDWETVLVCAQDAFHKKFYPDLSRDEFERRIRAKLVPIELDQVKVTDPDLKELGCSNQPRAVSVRTIFRASRPPSEFSWSGDMLRNLGS